MSEEGEKATVAGDEVRVELASDKDVDIKNRDPEQINQHLKLTFQEVFAEPDESIFSFDQIWRVAYKVFTTVKLWWYRILSLVFGVPLACIWGVIFACISFLQIWICVPYLKGYFIEMHCIKQVFQFTLEAFVIPMYEAAGRVFSFIRVTIVQG